MLVLAYLIIFLALSAAFTYCRVASHRRRYRLAGSAVRVEPRRRLPRMSSRL
jgi:hypothetical protein